MKIAKYLLPLATILLYCCTDKEIYLDPSRPVEQRVSDLMKRMTIQEKIGQLEMVAVWDMEQVHEVGMLDDPGVGAWIGDVDPIKHNELQAFAEQTRLKIPYLIGMDAVHGHAMVSGKTVFPTAITIASSFDPELVKRVSVRSASEIRTSGNHWTFAPTADIVQDSRWGRSGETYGECPFLSSRMVEAAVEGLQSDLDAKTTVIATVKHLIGGGASLGGINHASAMMSPQMLRTAFLPPFKAAIDAGVMSIMPGHNDVNGIPSHSDHHLLTGIIKEEYEWDGFYITDMLDIENLVRLHHTATDQKDAVRQAINAGNDMHMYSRDKQSFMGNLKELYDAGKVSQERIDDAVRRILTAKFRIGLFENRYIDPDGNLFADDSSKSLALEAARESIVLLKNENDILPLNTQKHKRILVTGPNADNQALLGDWSGPQPEDNVITVLKGMRSVTDAQILYSPSGRIRTKAVGNKVIDTTDPTIQNRHPTDGEEINDYSIAHAVSMSRNADAAVIIIGGYGLRYDWGFRTYGESADRPTIDFYGRQVELVEAIAATGTPIILVYINGSPLNNPRLTKLAAGIIEAWEPGMMGGQAVAEIIWGHVNPCGKLPITIPKSAGQIPMYYYKNSSLNYTGYGYGFPKDEAEPEFCFGHGLSYTTFECRDLNPQDTMILKDRPYRLLVEVENTGNRAGKQTIMAFVSDEVASIVVPPIQLCGFKKVYLEPGEKKQVEIEIPFEQFKLWTTEMKHVAEQGWFTFNVGFSVKDTAYSKRAEYRR